MFFYIIARKRVFVNHETGNAYKVGEAIIKSLTGKQIEVLLGERVFRVALIMGALGYAEQYGTVGQSAETAYNMCRLVAGLYMLSAVLQFIGLALVYNLDKKTVEEMNEELTARRAAAAAADSAEQSMKF